LKRSNNENIIADCSPFAGKVTLKDPTNGRVNRDSKAYCLETITLLPNLSAQQVVRLPPVASKTQG